MMKNKVGVTEKLFLSKVDMVTALDEGESVSGYIKDNLGIKFFVSTVDNKIVYFYQISGFEFIFKGV